MTTTPPPKEPQRDVFLAGIQFWLFFLLSFYALRYPLPLAIILGAVGGIAGGTIAGRWQVVPKRNDADHLVQGLDVEHLYESIRNRREQRYSEGRQRRQPMRVQDWLKLRQDK